MATPCLVKKYFDFTDKQTFLAEWTQLSPTDKEQLSAGIEEGSFAY